EAGYIAPRGALEEVLATIFAEVLTLDRIGVRDNFFDFGGHSLSATQIVSRVREAFHVEVAVRTIFEEPTVGGLAQALLKDHGERIERTAELLLQVSSFSDEEAAEDIDGETIGHRRETLAKEWVSPEPSEREKRTTHTSRTAPLSFSQQRLWFLDQ